MIEFLSWSWYKHQAKYSYYSNKKIKKKLDELLSFVICIAKTPKKNTTTQLYDESKFIGIFHSKIKYFICSHSKLRGKSDTSLKKQIFRILFVVAFIWKYYFQAQIVVCVEFYWAYTILRLWWLRLFCCCCGLQNTISWAICFLRSIMRAPQNNAHTHTRACAHDAAN